MAETRLCAVWHEILRQLRKQLLDFLVDKHRAVVDFRRIDAAQPEIQEVLQRAEVYCPDNRRPKRIRKRIARDFAFLTRCDKITIILDGSAAAVIIRLLDVLASLHYFDWRYEILRRVTESGAIVNIMGRAACIRTSNAMAHPLYLTCTTNVLNGERKVYVFKQRRMVKLQRILRDCRRRLIEIDELRRHVVRISQLLAERKFSNRTDESFIADYRLVDNAYLDFIHVYS